MQFLTRQLVFTLAGLWLAATFTFFLPQLLGEPMPTALGAAYGSYLGHLAHFDLGFTRDYPPQSVASVIGNALPWTLLLVGCGTVVSFVIGTYLGILSAWRGGIVDGLVTAMTIFSSALPYFFVAMIMLYAFGLVAGWFPIGTAYDNSVALTGPAVADVADHAFLPILSIVVSTLALWLLPMRNAMRDTLGEEYITLARAKGLRPSRIMFRYAARNALLPPLSGLAVQLGFVLSGNILVEDLFNYPGVGTLLVKAVVQHDVPVAQGVILLSAATILVANLLVSLVYLRLDPRVDG